MVHDDLMKQDQDENVHEFFFHHLLMMIKGKEEILDIYIHLLVIYIQRGMLNSPGLFVNMLILVSLTNRIVFI